MEFNLELVYQALEDVASKAIDDRDVSLAGHLFTLKVNNQDKQIQVFDFASTSEGQIPFVFANQLGTLAYAITHIDKMELPEYIETREIDEDTKKPIKVPKRDFIIKFLKGLSPSDKPFASSVIVGYLMDEYNTLKNSIKSKLGIKTSAFDFFEEVALTSGDDSEESNTPEVEVTSFLNEVKQTEEQSQVGGNG